MPFIANINSRSLMLEEFDKEYRGELKEPVSIVSKYITDMRLVKNIYNEFTIFKEKIALDGSGLSLDKLFAIVAYKNWNLDDFEKIKDGDSIIDKAIEAYSDFVETESSSLTSQVTSKRNKINTINSKNARINLLGGKLTTYIDNILKQLNATLLSITLNGTSYPKEELIESGFWDDVLAKGEENTLIINYRPNQIGYNLSLTLTTADLRSITQNSLDVDEWTSQDIKQLEQEIDELIAKQSKLNYLDMKGVLNEYSEFRVILAKTADGKIAKDKMAWDLIEAGHITDEFAHYTSIFHEYNMSLKARSFWLNNIRHNKASMFHKFEGDDDIKAMLEETGQTFFTDKSMYNIQLVDYLLNDLSDKRIASIMSNLAGGDDTDLKFINAYVKNGKKIDEFLELLTPLWPEIFMYIVNHKDMDNKKKAYFISLALENGNGSLVYYTSGQVADFIDKNSKNIILLTRSNDSARVEVASTIMQTLGVSFKSLDGLSELAKEAIEFEQLYDINESNLQIVLGYSRLPLDEIKLIDEVAYNHILSNIDSYIDLYVDSTDYMLAGKEGFEAVIDDVYKISVDALDRILDQADLSNCIVEDINKLPTDIWDVLIRNIIVANKLTNILAYFNFYNANVESDFAVNDTLAEYLNTAETVTSDQEYDDYDHEQIKAFIIAIINSDKINDDVKINIAHDCYTKKYLPVGSIIKKEGDFFGRLRENALIADSAESFNYIRDLSWNTKRSYITKSKKFLEYIDDLELTSDEMNLLIEDGTISGEIKQHIIEKPDLYAATISMAAARHLADFAVRNKLILNAEMIKVLADGGTADQIVQLLNLASNQLTLDNYVVILEVIGGEYKKLTENNKHPSFENTDYNQSLAHHLEELGAVSSYDDNGDKIKVNMKSKWR